MQINNIDELNNMHLDVLREIGNIGAGNAATALAKMLNRKIDMDVPRTKILEFKEISGMLGGAERIVVGVMLGVAGDIQGSIMIILEIAAAHKLVDMLMGMSPGEQAGLSGQPEFNEMEMSALQEIGNILAGSYLSALAGLTNLKIVPTVPDLAIDMAGAIMSVPAIEFGKLGDSVLYIETEFNEGSTRVQGDFFLIPDIESYETLLKALGVIG